jgi:hypothetical protein
MQISSFAAPDSVVRWSAIDDGVMGGLSQSRLRYDPAGYAVFEGHVSLERNGGFASVRCAPQAGLGVAGAVAYVLEARGDGHRYKLNLRTDDNFDGLQYQAAVVVPAEVWTRVRLALDEFRPTFRGRVVPGAPALDPARVRQLGFMIADRQAGPFALCVRGIEVVVG